MIPHSLKLYPETDLLVSIKEYSKENKIYGFITGIVGNLSKAAIQCPTNQSLTIFQGNLEIICLNGFFDYGNLHLHLSFSDENCHVFGGHLEEGSIVKKGAEILLLSVDKKIKNIEPLSFHKATNRVKIYTLNNCPWSKRAIRLLNSSNIDHDVELIRSDEEFEKLNSITNHHTFPQIFLDDQFFGGYDELSDQYKKDLLKSLR